MIGNDGWKSSSRSILESPQISMKSTYKNKFRNMYAKLNNNVCQQRSRMGTIMHQESKQSFKKEIPKSMQQMDAEHIGHKLVTPPTVPGSCPDVPVRSASCSAMVYSSTIVAATPARRGVLMRFHSSPSRCDAGERVGFVAAVPVVAACAHQPSMAGPVTLASI